MKNIPKSQLHKLSPKYFALSTGLVWGLAILLTGWIAMTGWATQFIEVISSIYTGYSASFIGGIVGGIWGFFFGSIIGGAIAILHNKLINR